MKLKLSCLFVIASFLMVSFLGGAVPAKDNIFAVEEIDDITENISETFFENIGEGENETIIGTVGPVGRLFNIAEINIIDGDPLKVLLIRWILNNNVFFIRPFVSIEVNDLAFSIKYTKNIPEIPILKRFSYGTVINEDGNESYFNKKHTLIVTGFNGTFGYYRKPIRLFPAYFTFIGHCDEVIVLT